VSPFAVASSLSSDRAGRLVDGIRTALADAEHDPGRYARGEATARLHVYGREGEPCERCGRAIRRVVQVGRSTFYCATCQR
jgi:formamidopyrimidine-DNA glycosylase